MIISDELLVNLSFVVGFIVELNYKNDNQNFVIILHGDNKNQKMEGH